MKRWIAVMLPLLLLALSACVEEDLLKHTDHVPDGTMVDLNFSLLLPSTNEPPVTRALYDYHEQELVRLDLLAFKVDGTQEKYAYHSSYESFRSYQDKVRFLLKVLKSTTVSYRFVILFNLSATQVSALDHIPPGTPKADVLEGIQVEQAGKWPSDGSKLFVLWGESQPVVVDDARIATGINGIKIARMMARIDVVVATPDAKNDFNLQSVYIYNVNHKGLVAPFSQHWQPSTNVVTAPSLPADPKKELGPLVYTQASTERVAFIREIYTFETPACQGQPLQTPCMVVGGYYGGESQLSYYRLDFLAADRQTYLDLLRNHCYTANITKVEGRGYDTPDEAFRGNVRMKAEVTPWNGAPQTTVFDRQYKLSLSRDKIQSGKEAFSASIALTTDYAGADTGLPAGILVGPVEYTTGGSGWLKIMNNSGDNGSMVRDIQVTGTANTTGFDRSAQFTVTAGNMNYVVKVNQSKDPWLTYAWASIYILDGEQGQIQASSDFDWTVELKPGTNLQGGLTELLTTRGGHARYEPVYFNKFNDWDDMMAGNPQKTADTVVFIFKDTEGVCPDVPVRIWMASGMIEGASNCYMKQPGSYPILIPVSRANEPAVTGTNSLGRQIGLKDELDARLIWTDVQAGLSPSGAVRSVIPAGDGETGYLLVRPGSIDGNAVVAVTTGGIIRWSWHIWVTHYQPMGNWIERNLGALSDVPGDLRTGGLLYQWGRKDPFPGLGDIWYDGDGRLKQPAIVTIDGLYYEPVTEITNSVRNPLAYFLAGYNARGNSWGGFSTPVKEIYDPCPPGYKVPVYTAWASLSSANFPWGGSGRSNASVGGFYPKTGARNNGGGLVQPGNGYYWSANSDGGDKSPRFSFTSGGVFYSPTSNTYSHCDAYAIRCVAEYPH